MAKNIEAFRLRTEVAVDNSKASPQLRATERDFEKLDQRVVKLGVDVNKLGRNFKGLSSDMRGAQLGAKFGQDFSSSATSLITGSIDSLGQTLGSVIGTAIVPGIGTAIGSTIGSGVDAAMSKVSGLLVPAIQQGIELNEQLELTRIEFTTFTGSEKEADRYLLELKKHAKDTGTDFNWVLDTSEHLYDLTNNLELSDVILRAATDHAADFGGKVETIAKVAEALGLIAEKGELASRELQKLYKLGIDAKKYLSQATGLTEKQIEKLMAEDRLRGDVAARLIAEGIEREKGGFAAKLTKTTTPGAKRKFAVETQLLAAEGTEKATKKIGDFYRAGNRLLEGEGAHQFAQFIDQTTGSLIDLVQTGLSTGINVTKGLADGIVSGDAFRAVGSAVTSLGDFAEKQLKSFFEIQSPSELMKREIGIPIGEGIAEGMVEGFGNRLKKGGFIGDNVTQRIMEFFRQHAAAAIEAMRQTGVPASVSLAQALIESGMGRSGLTQRANNFFGIKGTGPAGSVTMRTREETRSGQSYYINSPFRAYHSAEESFLDHAQFLLRPRYRGALKFADDPQRYTQAIAAAGYATDRNYAEKLNATIEKYGLKQYDSGLPSASAVRSSMSSPVTKNNPLPVVVVDFGNSVPVDLNTGLPLRDIDNASRIFQQQQTAAPLPDMSGYVMQLGEEDAAVVDVIATKEQLIQVDRKTNAEMRQLVNTSSLVPRALLPLIGAEKAHAETAIGLTKEYQEAARKQLVIGTSLLTKLSGAIGQISGFMPQQEVGKKRGFWSKVLGVAAPFLSFIPGVGPLLSQFAGMASAGLAGDWAGVATGVASGLAPGGVFRSSGNSTVGSKAEVAGKRAAGGPGVRGRVYWTGERGPEPFIAPENGYFLSHHDAMRAMSPAGMYGGDGSAMSAALERLSSILARLESMPADHVVRMGARGLVDAFDQDAGLIRLTGQKFRLA